MASTQTHARVRHTTIANDGDTRRKRHVKGKEYAYVVMYNRDGQSGSANEACRNSNIPASDAAAVIVSSDLPRPNRQVCSPALPDH